MPCFEQPPRVSECIGGSPVSLPSWKPTLLAAKRSPRRPPVLEVHLVQARAATGRRHSQTPRPLGKALEQTRRCWQRRRRPALTAHQQHKAKQPMRLLPHCPRPVRISCALRGRQQVRATLGVLQKVPHREAECCEVLILALKLPVWGFCALPYLSLSA